MYSMSYESWSSYEDHVSIGRVPVDGLLGNGKEVEVKDWVEDSKPDIEGVIETKLNKMLYITSPKHRVRRIVKDTECLLSHIKIAFKFFRRKYDFEKKQRRGRSSHFSERNA